jgi:hypothetical protein
MAPNSHASETSPLLGQSHDRDTNGQIDALPVDGGLTTDSADLSGDLERRQSLDESRAAQFQGVPEIHEKLRYILPALSIGVLSTILTKHAHDC